MIPQDPYILLSFVNTKLRDEYGSLEELCASLDLDKEELLAKLCVDITQEHHRILWYHPDILLLQNVENFFLMRL